MLPQPSIFTAVPLGAPGTRAYPFYSQPDGIYSEIFQARTMINAFENVFPYTDCAGRAPHACLTGLVFFNWQDVAWPGLPNLSPGHFPWLRSGLVYEDGAEKPWPVFVFRAVMEALMFYRP